MIISRYVVCSASSGKPVTRQVCDTKNEADTALEWIKDKDGQNPETEYWVAEIGPECEAWRWLAPDTAS